MKVLIRADASLQLGTGHIMRCLTLAEVLRQRGAQVQFTCWEAPGHLIPFIQQRHFPVQTLATEQAIPHIQGKLDWLIIDHYALDAHWENALRASTEQIMAIDDLANRPHVADVLLDQNLRATPERDYAPWVSPQCRLLLGPRYALLRPEFLRLPPRQRDGSIHTVLVFFGGADAGNATGKALEALKQVTMPLDFTVVVGSSNPHRDSIQRQTREFPRAEFLVQADNMAALLNETDLVLGGGGTTSWERCYLGAPAIVLVLADNQRDLTQQLERAGALINLGDAATVSTARITEAVEHLLALPKDVVRLGERARAQMANFQGAEGVANSLLHVAKAR